MGLHGPIAARAPLLQESINTNIFGLNQAAKMRRSLSHKTSKSRSERTLGGRLLFCLQGKLQAQKHRAWFGPFVIKNQIFIKFHKNTVEYPKWVITFDTNFTKIKYKHI